MPTSHIAVTSHVKGHPLTSLAGERYIVQRQLLGTRAFGWTGDEDEDNGNDNDSLAAITIRET